MKSDPLFRQFIYATLTQHKDEAVLRARMFLETNKEIPVCFLEGKHDKGVNVDYIKTCFDKYVAGNQTGSQFNEFNAGHAVFKMFPEQFKAVISSFISTTSKIKNQSHESMC
jgi:hypothetical protein